MIFDTVENCGMYYGLHENFEKAFDFIKKAENENLPAGKYEIDGKELYAIVQEYYSKNPEDYKFEGHTKYIDIQYVCSGVEEIEVMNIKNASEGEGYIEEREVEFFTAGKNIGKVVVGKGEYGILYPNDIHKPGLMHQGKSVPVRKILVKVLMK